MIAFSLLVIGIFTWYAHSIPQIESHPPRKISLDATLSEDEMVEAGDVVFNSDKSSCAICHAIGRRGNRGPDLAGIGANAARRRNGYTSKQYLLESLLQPGAYLVEGYGKLMPPMAGKLTPGEIMVTVAFLQSMGGEVDIRAGDVREALAALAPPPSSGGAPVPPVAKAGGEAGNPEEGKRVYEAQCKACHGPDPAKDGPVGPAILGSSQALIQARMMRAAYPPGYQPKRPTKLMPPLPHLEGEIPHLAAYLRGKP